jgi:hypothetical protein
MFRSLKNIDSAYQQTKTLALLFMVLCASVAGYRRTVWLRTTFTYSTKAS